MTQSVIEGLPEFMRLFLKWNQAINLSAARTPEDLDEHVRDCLHVVPLLDGAGRVLDVGSGGGLPVLIAALAHPATQFTSLEPVHKKHAFLRTAARELGLQNFEARAERVEDHVPRDYDVAMSRATFDLADWLTTGLTLVRPGGRVLGFEGVRRDDLRTPVGRHVYEISGKPRSIVVAARALP